MVVLFGKSVALGYERGGGRGGMGQRAGVGTPPAPRAIALPRPFPVPAIISQYHNTTIYQLPHVPINPIYPINPIQSQLIII